MLKFEYLKIEKNFEVKFLLVSKALFLRVENEEQQRYTEHEF